ncbi:CNVH-domain-containing protein [Massarina eburnea CBS 473.64]|uniref:CNVH-domain-containing protein n=1 Tax=Massarina eburnea CBS 473.64 TaxID=1395130 RepID=A0A6A6SGC1_9PLEO|nr:CNVH-domain-containing protein [Massarina eburnea CBS 473.64]
MSYGNNYQEGGYSQGGQENYGQQGHGGAASEFYGGGGQPQQGYGQQQGYGGSEGHHQQQQQYGGSGGYDSGPPQYQQYPSAAAHSSNGGRNSENQGYQNQYGGEGNPEGDRGIMGGLAGGAAGAFGGHALGGHAGHGTSGTVIGAIAGAFAGSKTQDAAGDWKHNHDEKKEEKKHEHQQQQQQQQHGGGGGGGGYSDHHSNDHRSRGDFGGNFTASSQDVRLDAHGDYNLHAQCRRLDGSYQNSTISLNRYLENDNGSFHWSGGSSNGGSVYTVQSGDTLRAIASRFSHCTYEELANHNHITNPDMIYPGQDLQVPGGGSRGGGNFGASARNMRLVDGGQRLEGELERNGQWHTASVNLDERIGNREGCLEFI